MGLKKLIFGLGTLTLTLGLFGCSNEQNYQKKENIENKIIRIQETQKKDTINYPLNSKGNPKKESFKYKTTIDANKITSEEKKNKLERKLTKKIKKDTIDYSKIKWEKIDEGLFYTEMPSKLKSKFGNSKIAILKINPNYYNFKLISAKEKKEHHLSTAKEWANKKNLLAVINAGMFLEDYQTNCGYMKNYNFINNNRLNRFKSILSFNRKDKTVPKIQIIDLVNQNWNELKTKYNSYTQGIRMIDINQKNVQSQQNKIWSTTCIGIDKKGNALFIFSRSPYSMHDLDNILIKSPLDIKNVMYLEGGPEASFYLNNNGKEIIKCGSYETGFNENEDNNEQWRIPNIIGIVKK